jgi:CRP-like cAMP-binding protein
MYPRLLDDPILLKTALFAGLNRDDYAYFAAGLEYRKLRQGEILFLQGMHGDAMAVLLTGRLAVTVGGPESQAIRVDDVVPGETVGEMSVIDPMPRSASVQADEDSEVAILSREVFLSLQATAPRIAAGIVGGLIRQITVKLRSTHARIERTLIERTTPEQSLDGPFPELPVGSEPARRTRCQVPADLRALGELKRLTSEDVRRVALAASCWRYPAGSELCRETHVGSTCFLVLEGEVDAVREVRGSETFLSRLSAGTWVGQMALVDRGPRSATVRAVGDVIVVEVERGMFERLIAGAGPMALRFQEEIAVSAIRQLRLTNRKLGLLAERVILREDGHEGVESEEAVIDQLPVDDLAKVGAAIREWDLPSDDGD